MPPLRTITPARQPQKTERTHEENQERAYVAASRGSDRGLEARMKSARRASDNHKKRTGRSLGVKEADVINEEVYEEEDNDLPSQYRRMTAHLANSNSDISRKLNAFLISQMGMRHGLVQPTAGSGSWPNNGNPAQFVNPAMNPVQNFCCDAGNGYRSTGQQNMQQQQRHHQRNDANSHNINSISSPHAIVGAYWQSMDDSQRMQIPAFVPASPTQGSHWNQSNDNHYGIQRISPSRSHRSESNTSWGKNGTPYMRQPQNRASTGMIPQLSASSENMINNNNNHNAVAAIMSPLTPTLPMEPQQLLAGGPWLDADTENPAMNLMMQHPEGISQPQPYYSYYPNGKGKSSVPSSSNGFN